MQILYAIDNMKRKKKQYLSNSIGKFCINLREQKHCIASNLTIRTMKERIYIIIQTYTHI